MRGGSSRVIDSNEPPISNAPSTVGSTAHCIDDEGVGRWAPIVALSDTQAAGLYIADVPNPTLPVLESPPLLQPQCDHIPNHTAASASHVNTDIGMLLTIPGHTQADASLPFLGAQPSAPTVPVWVTSQGIVYEELPQSVYDRGLPSEASRLPEMPFQGITLGDALRHDFRWLADHDREAWPANSTFEMPQKLAVVLCFPGYAKYSRQVNVLRHARGRTLPQTRWKLAHVIAEEMQSFMTLALNSGNPLVHGGRQITLDNLVLIDIQHVSKGSLQPTIGVVVHRLARAIQH